jgi:hypothetical protein
MMKTTATLILLTMLVGCASESPPTPPAQIQAPAAGQKRFDSSDGGITIGYPADWTPVQGSKSQLEVSAPSNGKGAGTLSLDVPHMPAIAKLGVPIGQVKSGYIDDAKKEISDVSASDLSLPQIAGVNQQGVKLAGHQSGKVVVEESDLIVRNNQVYIIAVKSDDKNEPFVHGVLEAVIKSVQWTK